MSYDNTCKYLAENYPSAFVRWLLEIEPQNIEILKTQLSLDPIYADSVTFLFVCGNKIQPFFSIIQVYYMSAPLTKSDSPQGLLTRVAERIGTIQDNFERAELTSCTQLLAGLRFDKDFVYQFLGEELMRESSVYQDIWQRAGKQKEEGLILRQLNRRLGQLEPSLLEQIKELSIEELDALGEALLDFSSIPDLSNWLSRTVAERN